MSQLTDAEVYAEIARIIEEFRVLECEDCARAMIEWCDYRGIETTLLEIRTRYRDEDYIISDRRSDDESITMNGKHYGVEIRGLVFDNLSPTGMTREDWKRDFHSPTDEFIVSELT